MKLSVASLLLVVMGSIPACAAEIVIDNFDAGVEKWSPTLQYGKVDGGKASRDAFSAARAGRGESARRAVGFKC